MIVRLPLPLRHLPLYNARRHLTTAANRVKIVEVGPRDGLQNEKTPIAVETKAELVRRLVGVGMGTVEVGSFVSPKWVPQMAGTAEVLKAVNQAIGGKAEYPVLVPNERGLKDLLGLLDEHPGLTDEVAVFTSATDGFNRANLNCSVRESLATLEGVVGRAKERGLKVRGYVSVVVWCPYEGRVKPERVAEVTKALVDMGCYEVSLGDTVGRARPHEVGALLEEVGRRIEVGKLAGHFHDTYGTAVANVLTALQHGIRTIDASVGGLGGCPYSPGATGNVATEDVVYALQESGYTVQDGNINLEALADVGSWICGQLGRETGSRVGRALVAKKERERRQQEKEKAKL